MVEVYGSTVKIPRGDSARLVIAIRNKVTGDLYALSDGEFLRFTVTSGSNTHGEMPILEKTLTEQDAERKFTVVLTPRELEIPQGRYHFRVSLCNKARETVDTVIGGTSEALLFIM